MPAAAKPRPTKKPETFSVTPEEKAELLRRKAAHRDGTPLEEVIDELEQIGRGELAITVERPAR